MLRLRLQLLMIHVLPAPACPCPADTLIEQASGKKVSEIFAEEGEASFREVETQVLAVSVVQGMWALPDCTSERAAGAPLAARRGCAACTLLLPHQSSQLLLLPPACPSLRAGAGTLQELRDCHRRRRPHQV
jgi:hypothetical protein